VGEGLGLVGLFGTLRRDRNGEVGVLNRISISNIIRSSAEERRQY
jgi:hypothetical protein